jgi:hypothetical protein
MHRDEPSRDSGELEEGHMFGRREAALVELPELEHVLGSHTDQFRCVAPGCWLSSLGLRRGGWWQVCIVQSFKQQQYQRLQMLLSLWR